ncbi:MAG: sugar-transfer associated ATP-grasp domain-containing protein [Coraliomargarita sp.]
MALRRPGYGCSGALAHFEQASLQQHYVLQRTSYNHPSIEKYSTGGLISFRTITVAGRDGEAVMIAAYMGMPRANCVVNHPTHGGLVTEFDLNQKVFAEAFTKKPYSAIFTEHPETGAQVAGEGLEVWPEIEELSLRAHKAFPGIFAIGLDIVYTRDAYVCKFLELLRSERAEGRPLGELL